MTTPAREPQSNKRVKAYTLAKELGLDRDDRIEMAKVLLWRDITSWKQLSDSQMERILDALEGYLLVTHLHSLKV